MVVVAVTERGGFCLVGIGFFLGNRVFQGQRLGDSRFGACMLPDSLFRVCFVSLFVVEIVHLVLTSECWFLGFEYCPNG